MDRLLNLVMAFKYQLKKTGNSIRGYRQNFLLF